MFELGADIKTTLAIIGIIVCFIGYYPYFRDIIKGKTRPHAFSWLIWGILIGMSFVIQLQEQGGFGSWVNGVTACICLIIAGIGFYKKEISYTKIDWICLGLSGVAFLLLITTKNPFYTILLISFTDFLGFIPTYKKIYSHPHSETILTWYLMNVRTFLGIIAMDVYSFNTIFYPIIIFLLNTSAIMLMHYRKRKIASIGYTIS